MKAECAKHKEAILFCGSGVGSVEVLNSHLTSRVTSDMMNTPKGPRLRVNMLLLWSRHTGTPPSCVLILVITSDLSCNLPQWWTHYNCFNSTCHIVTCHVHILHQKEWCVLVYVVVVQILATKWALYSRSPSRQSGRITQCARLLQPVSVIYLIYAAMKEAVNLGHDCEDKLEVGGCNAT